MPFGWFTRRRAVVSVVHLRGLISAGRVGSLSLERVERALEAAFRGVWRTPDAVALNINSPGGSPVQSALLHRRVRELAAERGVRVLTFAEDVAASGGYYLLCAGDVMHASEASIVGSVGVASSGFGFPELLAKLGVERRLYTAGGAKGALDPFLPQQPADVARRHDMLRSVHHSFRHVVLSRRGAALAARRAAFASAGSGADEKTAAPASSSSSSSPLSDEEACSGAVWTGAEAAANGMVDAVGDLGPVLRSLYGQDVIVRTYGARRSPLDLLAPSAAAEALAATLEERLAYARFFAARL